LIPLVFHTLDLVHDPAAQPVVLSQIDAQFPGLVFDVALPRQIRDEDPLLVSHPFGGDMLVGQGILEDGAYMDPSLVGEGAAADKGPGIQRGDVGHIGHVIGQIRQVTHRLFGEAVLPHFQLEIGDDGNHIGIAAALPVAVYGPLDHRGTGPDRRQGVGHSQAPVVVGMDSQLPRRHVAGDFRRHGLDFMGQRPAVGIAQDDPVGTRRQGRGYGLTGVIGIPPIAVEEMLGVVYHFFSLFFEVGDGFPDHGQVLFRRNFQDISDMEIPGLAENGHHRGFRGNQGPDVGAFLHQQIGPAGAAEGRQAGVLELNVLGQLEKTHVLGIGTRPASLDIGEPHLIQTIGNAQLFLGSEIDLFSLRTIPEGGIVHHYLPHLHKSFSSRKKIRYQGT